MTVANSPLRRSDLRTEIASIELRGIATRSADSVHGPFMIWDISDRGLRIWTPERIQRGEVIKLTVAKPFIVVLNCDVRWCKAVADGGIGFQIGLRVLDNLQRLESLHKAVARIECGEADAPFSPGQT